MAKEALVHLYSEVIIILVCTVFQVCTSIVVFQFSPALSVVCFFFQKCRLNFFSGLRGNFSFSLQGSDIFKIQQQFALTGVSVHVCLALRLYQASHVLGRLG